MKRIHTVVLVAFLLVIGAPARAQALPSWNDGAAKSAIVAFVRAVTDSKSKDYVAPRDRIAVFDNDGTLWCEQPLVQLLFMVAAGEGRRLALLVHHDDAEREFAYDRQAHTGRLDKAWDEAKAKNWIVVSMKNDWRRIFSFEK